MTTALAARNRNVRDAPLAIFVATRAEARPICRALHASHLPSFASKVPPTPSLPLRGGRVREGVRSQEFHAHGRAAGAWGIASSSTIHIGLEGQDLLLAKTGMGPENATAAARRLFEETRVGAALSLGVAGGLSPQLQTGDLIVADRVILRRGSGQVLHGEEGTMSESFSCDAGLRQVAIAAIRKAGDRHHLGPILSIDWIVQTVEEKRALAAESGAMAVDMESAAIAAAASACRVPFLAIRGVLDPVHEELGIAFDQFLDSRGEPNPLSLIRYLLAHPFALPHLLRLGRRTKAVCARLGLLLHELSTTLS